MAVMLSAQCTDKRINMVTPALFRRYPTAKDMALSNADEILPFIKSVTYPNAKARHLWEMSVKLTEMYDGNVPDTLEALQTLPGVGRKTANVILATIFGKPAMPVDTHVFRVTHRLGLVPESAKTPDETERILRKNIPEEMLSKAHHWFLLHGRYVCTAKKPLCDTCELATYCQKATAK